MFSLGDLEVYDGESRLDVPYTDESRNQQILVIVGRDKGGMEVKAHEVSPSGWITYSSPLDPATSTAVDPLMYFSEVLGFPDVRDIHLERTRGVIKTDTPSGSEEVAQDDTVTVEDVERAPPSVKEGDEVLPPDPMALRPEDYRTLGWSLRLPLNPRVANGADDSANALEMLYVQGRSDRIIISD